MISQFINSVNYKSVICLNSNVPQIVSSLQLPIIATDGAADTLVKYRNISPDFVVGDMDSITDDTLQRCRVVRIDDQDTTDFEKAIFFAKDHNFFPAIITGLEGGFLDRTLNNFATFSACNSEDLLYLSDENLGFCIINNSKNFHIPIGTKMSIFGTPSATVTTQGLKWNLDRAEFSFFGYNSCSNRVASETINIAIENGSVFVLIYTQPVYDAGLIA